MTPLETNTSKIQDILNLVNSLPPVGVQLPPLTNPSGPAQILEGYEAIDGTGEKITGSIPDVAQATPSITVSSTGLITASSQQEAGYVPAGTQSATKQLTTQAAQTITPGTSNKTIASGRYLTGTQTIKGDSNLVAENIVSGKSIFGVAGTASGVQVEIVEIPSSGSTRTNFQIPTQLKRITKIIGTDGGGQYSMNILDTHAAGYNGSGNYDAFSTSNCTAGTGYIQYSWTNQRYYRGATVALINDPTQEAILTLP